MKILRTILLTILLSATCHCSPLAEVVEDTSSMFHEEDYYDARLSNFPFSDEMDDGMDDGIALNTDDDIALNTDDDIGLNMDEDIALNTEANIALNTDDNIGLNVDDGIALNMDEDIALSKISSLCLTNCNCTSRGENAIVDVDCMGKGMTSIPIPDKDFEIFVRLDFSTNELVTLHNNSFRYFPLVEVILLSVDKIETVDVDAFNGLNNLKEVDLSDNNIMYIHPDMFKENLNLERVTLSGNPLVQVSAMSPFLNAPTLEFLDISNCKLQSLSQESFTNLKSLRNLDLSNNYLQTLSVDILVIMADLETVSLDKNRWRCDCSLQILLEYVSSNNSTEIEPMLCLVSDNGEDQVWSTSSSITNCQNDLSPPLNIFIDTEGNLDSFVLIQEISEEVEVETIFIPDRFPDSNESKLNPDAEEKAMVFGSIIFYLQHKSRSVYASLILVAIIITTILLSIVCLKIIINSRTEQADRENQRKKNLMLSFGVEFEDKRNSFSPLLDPSSPDHDGLSTPPYCEWRPFAKQYDNPQSLFEEYVSSGRPYHVYEITKGQEINTGLADK